VVVMLAVLTGGIRFVWTGIDQRRFPWGYPEPGKPTLIGTWVGTMTTGGGVRRGVYMDLRLEPLRFGTGRSRRRRSSRAFRNLRNSNFEGEVRMCGGPREQRFAINTGTAEDKEASRFRIGLSPTDSTPPDGLAPSHIRGRWNGGDSLALEADLYLRRGASAMSSTDDPDTGKSATLGMTRGDEARYRALCAGNGYR
jgi:hypothetical protein